MKKRLLMCLMALGMYQAQATNYWVNDGFVEAGSICSAVGNAGNSGLNPGVPKTLNSIFGVQPGDIVYIDKGTYVNLWGCSGGLGSGTAANHIKFIGVDSTSTIIEGNTSGTDAMQLTCSANADLYWDFSNIKMRSTQGLTTLLVGIGAKNYTNVTFTNCLISSEVGPAINVANGCGMNYFTFTGCKFQSTSTYQTSINMSGATNATYNSFINCQFVHVANNTATMIALGNGARFNNTFDKCTFTNAGTGNIFDFPGGNYENTVITNCQFKGNNAGVVANIGGGNALTGFKFVNNYVAGFATGIASGNPNQGGMDISNNSFYTTSSCLGNANPGGNFLGATIRNNIFYTTGTGTTSAIIISATTNLPAVINYNHYYMPNGANAGNYAGTAKANLTAWANTITSISNDANSSTGNPGYTAAATGDLSIACSSLAYRSGLATTLTTDIFGSTRPATPSKGAYENTTVVTVTATPTSASYCAGGSASITASGGTTYAWSPATALSATTGATVTANPTATTTYTITGTTAGCSGTTTVVITVNDLPTISVSPAAPAICEGGSVELTASGATSYSWTPATDLDATTGATVNATPTTGITYTVTGTDANTCSNTADVTVTVNTNPATPTLSNFADVCSNASAVTLSGATPAGGAYSGTSVASGEFDPSIGAGTYTITYTYTDANNCSSEVDADITVNDAPSVTQSAFTDLCSGDPSVTLTGGAPAGGTYSGTGVTAGSFSPATAGAGTHTITYAYTDANGCSANATADIMVSVCTGVSGANGSITSSVYPNPNDGSFLLSFDPNKSGNVEMVLLNAQGQEQYRRKISVASGQSSEKISVDLTPGVYHMQLIYNGSTSHEKVVIR